MKPYLFCLIFLFCSACTNESDFRPYLGLSPPGEAAEVFAPGIVSTDKSELNSVFAPDGEEFYFSRSKKPGSAALQFMKFKEGIWTQPQPVSFATGQTDLNPTITTDGKTLFFASLRDDTRGPKDIYVVERLGNKEWGIPKNLGSSINSKGNDNHPSVAEDGTLYFHSDGLGGFGKQDIFKSEWIDGAYAEAENIGDPINTENGEFDTYIARDESYLIFGSDRSEDCFGKTDLYISYRTADGTWSKAINLGEAINSPEYELCPNVTDDGKYFFFTSYCNGHGDIFWITTDILKKLKPKDLN